MNFQYISDSNGQTTGFFIPINEWNKLKSKYEGFEQENVDVPDWHKDLVREGLKDYRENPSSVMDFDSAIDEIEKEM